MINGPFSSMFTNELGPCRRYEKANRILFFQRLASWYEYQNPLCNISGLCCASECAADWMENAWFGQTVVLVFINIKVKITYDVWSVHFCLYQIKIYGFWCQKFSSGKQVHSFFIRLRYVAAFLANHIAVNFDMESSIIPCVMHCISVFILCGWREHYIMSAMNETEWRQTVQATPFVRFSRPCSKR